RENPMTLVSSLLLITGLIAVADDPAKDLDKLQGTWLTVSIVNNGKTLVDEKTPPSNGPVTKLVYEGNKWTIKVGDRTVASGIIKVDSTTSPKQIDIFDESGVRNEKTRLVIYELDGDIFKYCIAEPGKTRPTELVSEQGTGHSLIVSRREKR